MNDDLFHALKQLLDGFIRENLDNASLPSVSEINEASSSDSSQLMLIDAAKPDSFRIANEEESHRLSTEAFSFLEYLQRVQILDAVTREALLDRLMRLENYSLDITDVKRLLINGFGQPMSQKQRQRLNLLLVDGASLAH